MDEDMEILGVLDSPGKICRSRDAAIIETRLSGLLVSKNTVETELDSVERPQDWCGDILKMFSARMMKLTSHELWEAEKTWTDDLSSDPVIGLGEAFHTRLMYQTYLDVEAWHQVRELTFFAISEEALRILMDRFANGNVPGKESLSPQSGSLSQEIRTLRSASLHANLTADDSRTSIVCFQPFIP